jgi:hypothetical protein
LCVFFASMKLFQRIFILFFAVWLLIGQIGFAFQSKKCLITGSKKWNISKNVTCCIRDVSNSKNKQFSFSKSSCCAYNQYVVKFNFSIEKVKLDHFSFLAASLPVNHFSFLGKKTEERQATFFVEQSFHPPSCAVRLAFLQSYLI